MATNFEFYKDEILAIAHESGRIAIVNGKPTSILGLSCMECDFKGGEKICNAALFNWLYAEHIELPNLTKRERAFCEAVQEGWIARDRGGKLYWYSRIPEKEEWTWCTDGKSGVPAVAEIPKEWSGF